MAASQPRFHEQAGRRDEPFHVTMDLREVTPNGCFDQ
jgi:hypothetical protein